MKIGDASFFETLGEVAAAVGTAEFHPGLMRLLSRLVPAEAQSVLRYSRFAAPEYLIHIGLPGYVVDLYLSGYYRFDPFYRYWRERGRGGVVRLADVVSPELAESEYFSVFVPKAGIADDLGVFLPITGGAAIALFVERTSGRFTRAEAERLARLYPAVAGLHKAHLARLILSLAGDTGAAASPEAPRAVLVVDREGRRVFTSRAWRDVEAGHDDLDSAVASLDPRRLPSRDVAGAGSLYVEALDADFALAPGGRMYVLEAAGPTSFALDFEPAVARFLPDELTPREREIVRYILAGYSTEAIAKTIGIGRGTVKNHRARLYYKLDITSERELFSLFLEFLAAAETGTAR